MKSKLNERERLILMAAYLCGRPLDDNPLRACCGKVIAQALVWAGLWSDQMIADIQGANDSRTIVDDWYETLITMTKTAPDSERLIWGAGNLGSPVGDLPAAPAFTACGLTAKGRELAEVFFAEYPDMQGQPKEFFRCL